MSMILGRHNGSLNLESSHLSDSIGQRLCSHGRETQLLSQPKIPKQAVERTEIESKLSRPR